MFSNTVNSETPQEIEVSNTKNLLFLLLLSTIISIIISNTVWNKHNFICHTVVEMICVIIAISSFIVIWCTYKHASPVDCILAFGFLSIAIYDALHIYTFQGIDIHFYPEGYYDLSTRYWLLGRITEAVVLAICTIKLFQVKLNKWISLTVILFITITTSCFVYNFPGLMPVMLKKEGLTPRKIFLEYIIIIIFLITLLRIKKKAINTQMISEKYILLALSLAIPAEICFTLFQKVTSFENILGHTLKLIYYYCLFKGIFVSAVTYPYEKLENTNNYMDKILNGMPIGLIAFNKNNKIVFANKRTEEIIRCSRDELSGLSPEELIDTHCESEVYGESLVRRVVQTDAEVLGEVKTWRRKNSEELKVNITLRRYEEGVLVYIDEARKEQELEHLQLQTQTVLNSVKSVVLMVDKNNRIIMCNSAFEEICDTESKTVTGMHLKFLYKLLQCSKKDIINKELHVNKKSISMKNGPYELDIITPKAKRKTLLINLSTIYNVDNEVVGGIVLASDITTINEERKKLEQKERLALLGQMGAGIVHETKNLLAAIKGCAQVIMIKSREEEVRKYACKVNNISDDMNKVINEILELSKPKNKAFKEVPLSDLIQSIKIMLESTLMANQIKLSIVDMSEDSKILCDDTQMKQVILNIVKNASEALNHADNPTIIVSAGLRKSKSEVFISISDNGQGISDDDKIKLGTPFFTTKENGTGLGLSMCYRIISEHGGEIKVRSKLGKGTTFVITLPCASYVSNSFLLAE